ncbi:Caspase domain-containing protein [Paraburkholderia tropica]|uniref:caspase family protein n=1 Tax=Paraburkholderia tropica TaxID=92647 RepID=UPI001CAD5849|nr:caspase family protein [Paraburkholderia tropica]CAG9217780.1 Caspase domain-containing protein [Paraburkholderia tropica]
MNGLRRRALIIGCPDAQIPGVRDDMENYPTFFKSAAGGGWFSSEITVLESPTVARVKSEIQALQTTADYSVVVFAGHGRYSPADGCGMLLLSPGVEIDENELKFGASRRTVIIDACRVLPTNILLDSVRASLEKYAQVGDIQASRRLFDEHLSRCSGGIAMMYGCAIGEGAQEERGKGGYYSAALINEGRRWGESSLTTPGGVLTVSDAHDAAEAWVKRNTGSEQNPHGAFPRNLPRFPFAVRAR